MGINVNDSIKQTKVKDIENILELFALRYFTIKLSSFI